MEHPHITFAEGDSCLKIQQLSHGIVITTNQVGGLEIRDAATLLTMAHYLAEVANRLRNPQPGQQAP